MLYYLPHRCHFVRFADITLRCSCFHASYDYAITPLAIIVAIRGYYYAELRFRLFRHA